MATTNARSRKGLRPEEELLAPQMGLGHGWTLRVTVVLLSIHAFISQLAIIRLTLDTRMMRGQDVVNSAVAPNLRAGRSGLTPQPLNSTLEPVTQERSAEIPATVVNSTIDSVAVMNGTIAPSAEANSTIATAEVVPTGVTPATVANATSEPVQAQVRPGFIVLGMHRSGTSMLTGVFVNGLGYNVGGPLIPANNDNKKGYFERIDVVNQNDEFMKLQQGDWRRNIEAFDAAKALLAKTTGEASFENGKPALEFFNNGANSPWLQKDPRMCITLKTWMPLFSREPAVLWTYRHPLEVAHSLMARESWLSLDFTLRLWIVYNIRGLQNSRGLCRVFTSNDAILADPLAVIQRLSHDLTTKCGVPAPPKALSQQEVADFLDLSLQRSKKKVIVDQPVLEQHGDCQVHDFVTQTATTDAKYEVEKKLYLIAMKLYCDMGSEEAYKEGYDWSALLMRLAGVG